jgi:hypothetical protein
VLGLAIVIAFVFLGSGDTIDDPSLSGAEGEQPAVTQPAPTQPAPTDPAPAEPGQQPPPTTTQP